MRGGGLTILIPSGAAAPSPPSSLGGEKSAATTPTSRGIMSLRLSTDFGNTLDIRGSKKFSFSHASTSSGGVACNKLPQMFAKRAQQQQVRRSPCPPSPMTPSLPSPGATLRRTMSGRKSSASPLRSPDNNNASLAAGAQPRAAPWRRGAAPTPSSQSREIRARSASPWLPSPSTATQDQDDDAYSSDDCWDDGENASASSNACGGGKGGGVIMRSSSKSISSRSSSSSSVFADITNSPGHRARRPASPPVAGGRSSRHAAMRRKPSPSPSAYSLASAATAPASCQDLIAHLRPWLNGAEIKATEQAAKAIAGLPTPPHLRDILPAADAVQTAVVSGVWGGLTYSSSSNSSYGSPSLSGGGGGGQEISAGGGGEGGGEASVAGMESKGVGMGPEATTRDKLAASRLVGAVQVESSYNL
jgi:hypothetical protein